MKTISLKPGSQKAYTNGFTLLEVMISLAVISGLLVTLIYTLNFHLGIAEGQESETVAIMLAREKLEELRDTGEAGEGKFKEPNDGYSFKTEISESVYPGVSELTVTVTEGSRKATLKTLVRSRK